MQRELDESFIHSRTQTSGNSEMEERDKQFVITSHSLFSWYRVLERDGGSIVTVVHR